MPVKKKPSRAIVPIDRVQQRILIIRAQRIILSADLAALYGVPPKQLNQAVQRNRERFPDDFMFQLTPAEFRILKSQFVTSSWGGARRARPYAFTEQGVAMLSAVLRSPTAVRVSIEIVRAFVRLRQLLASHEDLRHKFEALERKLSEHDRRFTIVFDAIRQLMEPPDDPPKPPIGFHTEAREPRAIKAKRK
jgi:hypothetical protein